MYGFSQPKSGTTLICNTIAFYNAELIGQKNYSFNSVSELGIGRSLMRDLSEVEKLIIFKSISNLTILLIRIGMSKTLSLNCSFNLIEMPMINVSRHIIIGIKIEKTMRILKLIKPYLI